MSVNRRSKNQEASVSKKRQAKRSRPSHYPFLIFISGLAECVLAGFKTHFECTDTEPNDPGYIAVEVFYLFIILCILLFSVPVFLYSAKFFPELYQEQLEIAARAVERYRLNTTSNIETDIRPDAGGTRQMSHEQKSSNTPRRESKVEMEYKQMKRQIANLKLFFYTISFIIAIKYLVQATYDLVFFFLN